MWSEGEKSIKDQKEIINYFALYKPQTTTNSIGYFLPLQSTIKENNFQSNDVIELRKRNFSIPILFPDGEKINFKFDFQTRVFDCMKWIEFNFDHHMENFRLFLDGKILDFKNFLFSFEIDEKKILLLREKMEKIFVYFVKNENEKKIDNENENEKKENEKEIVKEIEIEINFSLKFRLVVPIIIGEIDIDVLFIDNSLDFSSFSFSTSNGFFILFLLIILIYFIYYQSIILIIN